MKTKMNLSKKLRPSATSAVEDISVLQYIYIYIVYKLTRYVYSIDHVTCSTYVCICAAAILVLLATFELTE